MALHAKAKAEPSFRFYALYDKISRDDMLAHAYAQCRSNKGAAGVDGQDFADIEAYGVERWLGELALALREESYRPDPIRRVFIPKANGKLRPLGISTVRDRVCMTAAMLVLEPIFEADLPPEQYAYRPGRNAQQAVIEVAETLFYGRPEVVDADLADYFGSIPHAELMLSLARRIVDRRVLHLIKMWLECSVEETDNRGRKTRTTQAKDQRRGIPQGSPITPWTQKITLSLSDRLHSAVRSRYLTCVVKGNMVASHGPIYSLRKGSALECCIRSDRPWFQPQRGRRGVGRAVRFIAPPSLPIPAGGARTQAPGSSLRADHSHHDQGSWRRSGRASGVRANERPDHWRDGGACRLRFPHQGAPAWLIAACEAMTFTWNMPLTAYWQQNWRRSMTSLCRIASAAPASLVR
jgi:retron-type reverse transcriptase